MLTTSTDLTAAASILTVEARVSRTKYTRGTLANFLSLLSIIVISETR